MFSLFLILLVAAWIAWPFLMDRRVDRQEDQRALEKIAVRRRFVDHNPESAMAHEALGDALREAKRFPAALAAFEAAQRLGVGSPGLETKIRLARLDCAEMTGEVAPRRREQACRTCGTLGAPDAEHCRACGAPFPVDGFFDSMKKGNRMRHGLIRELTESMTMLAIVCVAIGIAVNLSVEIRVCLIISTFGVLLWRFLKRIGDGPIG